MTFKHSLRWKSKSLPCSWGRTSWGEHHSLIFRGAAAIQPSRRSVGNTGLVPTETPTTAKTQVWNCPALTENSSCRTRPQSWVNYKAAELNPSLANGFWTRTPRFHHPSPSTSPLVEQRSSLLEPEELHSLADSSGAETPSHIACVMQKT